MGTYMLIGEPKDAVEDRVYRLYYNEGQNRADKFAQVSRSCLAEGLQCLHVHWSHRAALPQRAAPCEMQIGAAAGALAAVAQGQGSSRSRAWARLASVQPWALAPTSSLQRNGPAELDSPGGQDGGVLWQQPDACFCGLCAAQLQLTNASRHALDQMCL